MTGPSKSASSSVFVPLGFFPLARGWSQLGQFFRQRGLAVQIVGDNKKTSSSAMARLLVVLSALLSVASGLVVNGARTIRCTPRAAASLMSEAPMQGTCKWFK